MVLVQLQLQGKEGGGENRARSSRRAGRGPAADAGDAQAWGMDLKSEGPSRRPFIEVGIPHGGKLPKLCHIELRML